METAFAIIGTLIAGALGYGAYKRYVARKKYKDRDADIFEKLAPLTEIVEKGEDPDPALLQALAQDTALRSAMYAILKVNEKTHLFPKAFLNFEAGAETAMVYWLLHPNELGQSPDHIKFLKKVQREYQLKGREEKEPLDYYVFQFRMDEPHWAAEFGSVLGVTGPYVAESEPYDSAPATFSRYTSAKELDAEALVLEAHTAAVNRGLF